VNGSADYIDRYREGGIYDDATYGSPYISKGVKFARFMQKHLYKKSKILCIGCGNGFEVIEYLNQGHDAYGTEVHPIDNVKPLDGRIINAVVPELPFKDKEFDLLHCTEVLEHIPTDTTDDFLKECRRVSHKQFFSIATEMDTQRTHINLQTPGWWSDKFTANNFKIVNFQFKPITSNIYGTFLFDIHYSDGVTILCE
jgi:ubiquinone/menaquinone biosynthesis C-methylase UbiE